MAGAVSSVTPALAATPAAVSAQAAPDYPAIFGDYVVRSAATLRQRLAANATLSRAAFTRQRDNALHVLTFALGSEQAWPAARDLLLALAEPMEQDGARNEWLPFLYRGFERSKVLADHSAEAELSLRISHLHRLTSNFDVARRWLDVSLCCFRALSDCAGMARTLNQLAYVDCLLHCQEVAIERATAALGLLSADDHERAMSFFVLGMVAADRWRWVEAEEHHRAALVIRQRQGDARRIAWAVQNVGYALQGQGRFAEAIDCLMAASATLDELGDKANRAIVLMNLARTYHLDGQLAQAMATHLVARAVLHEVGDRLHLARIAANLGLNYLALDDPRAALDAFRESVAIFGELGNVADRLNSTSGVAMAYLALGAYADATAVLAPALDELAPMENVPGKAVLMDAMSQNLARARVCLAAPG